MIYEPKGKAREYSPLAVNLYKGCGHGCLYCYVPNVIKITRKQFDENISFTRDILSKLKKAAKKYAGTDKQVLMSFTTDPYNVLNEKFKFTREALKVFLQNQIPVAILSKAGKKVLSDLDVIRDFGKHIKVGASLTLDNEKDSRKWERNAALPAERFEALLAFHQNGIRTWASLEPVIDPVQTLKLIEQSHSFIDEYQIGKLNHLKNQIDWEQFLIKAVELMYKYSKDFYVKKDLRECAPEFHLEKVNTDQDYLTVPKFATGLFG